MKISGDKKDRIRKKVKLVSAIFKMLLFLFILIGLPLYLYFFHHDLIDEFSSMENVNAFFSQYKTESVFVYIGAQSYA